MPLWAGSPQPFPHSPLGSPCPGDPPPSSRPSPPQAAPAEALPPPLPSQIPPHQTPPIGPRRLARPRPPPMAARRRGEGGRGPHGPPAPFALVSTAAALTVEARLDVRPLSRRVVVVVVLLRRLLRAGHGGGEERRLRSRWAWDNNNKPGLRSGPGHPASPHSAQAPGPRRSRPRGAAHAPPTPPRVPRTMELTVPEHVPPLPPRVRGAVRGQGRDAPRRPRIDS